MSTSSEFRMLRPITVTGTILASSNVTEADATEWTSAGAPYAADAVRMVTTTANGASEATHKIYRSTAASNSADPTLRTTYVSGDDDVFWWEEVGSTNRFKMFNQTYGTQTENADSIVVVLTPGELINTAHLGNLVGTAVTATQSVTGWTQTIELNSHPVDNWYDWYYEPLLIKSDCTFTDIPPYPASTLTVTVANTGSTAKCGVCIIGQSAYLGMTQWEVLGGIVSYSGTSTDANGNTVFTQRINAKKLNLEVKVDAGFEDEAFRLLTEYTDVPTVFIGSSEYQMTTAYGFLQSWEVPISISGRKAPITIQSLI